MAIVSTTLRGRLLWTIHVARLESRNAAGDEVYGTPIPLAAHVEEDRKLVIGVDGTERQTTHVIITEDPILVTDRVWLPDADTSDIERSRYVTRVAELPSPAAVADIHHYETEVGDTFRRRTR